MSKKCAPKTISIDGVDYVRAEDAWTPIDGEEYRITIVDNRGLMYVGWVDLSGELPEVITIRRARCVIRWGTTKHIAELANNGPTKNTALGDMADVEVFTRQLVVSYRTNPEKWDD